MSDDLDRIIEEAVDQIPAEDSRCCYYSWIDIRAVAEAAYEAGMKLQPHTRLAVYESARLDLARELLAEGFELIDINGRRRHVIETAKIRKIAEGDEMNDDEIDLLIEKALPKRDCGFADLEGPFEFETLRLIAIASRRDLARELLAEWGEPGCWPVIYDKLREIAEEDE